jgi:hypothetical protein
MNEKEIDEILKRQGSPAPDPALLARISAQMTATLKPVRPIASPWMLASALILIAAVTGTVGASILGFYGVRELGAFGIGTMFPALATLTILAAALSVSAVIPGRAGFTSPFRMLALAVIAFVAIDAVLFHDYDLGAFLPEGINCLLGGLEVALPAGIASWLILRRGFAVDPFAAGLSAGTLAGLAGVVMLELHCPNFRAPHVMVWHSAVIPVSAVLCALVSPWLQKTGYKR